LGRIRIDARMDGPRLQVLVQTETTAARELLRSRAADLQVALEQHGVKVERFEFAPIGLQDQQNHTAMFADAGDPNARRSAWQRDEHQAADRGEPNRVPGDDQHARPEEPEGTEAIYSAAAETRLDVRV
jgi:flagellar hook-length control protein FliK